MFEQTHPLLSPHIEVATLCLRSHSRLETEPRLEPKILDFEISFFLSISLVLIENWIFLLVDVKLKDTTKPKSERRKDLFLAEVKRTLGIFLKAVGP